MKQSAAALKILKTDLRFTREPLLAPFGFKGGSVDELWQILCRIEDAQGREGVGLGVQSILWSDADVFAAFSQSGGNAAMLLVTQRALKLLENRTLTTPPDLIDAILPELFTYACTVTGNASLKMTFVLNALVPVDFALWQLYAAQHGIGRFDDLTASFSRSLTCRHTRLGVIPLVTYGMPLADVRALAGQGVFLFKIKLGQDPGGRHDPAEMLSADKQRALAVHQVLKDFETPHTDCGRILYYFDANGRYDSKARLLDLLGFLDREGILARTVILEEPFPETLDIPVGDLPVRIAGDERAHSPEDVRHLIDDLGYGAIALKPIAKTLSLSLSMLDLAAKRQVPCFCADLTVSPALCDWNRNVACRMAPLPGLKTGVMESNGRQNYRNWDAMLASHPIPDAVWLEPVDGLYQLDERFYTTSGGVLLPPRLA